MDASVVRPPPLVIPVYDEPLEGPETLHVGTSAMTFDPLYWAARWSRIHVRIGREGRFESTATQRQNKNAKRSLYS